MIHCPVCTIMLQFTSKACGTHTLAKWANIVLLLWHGSHILTHQQGDKGDTAKHTTHIHTPITLITYIAHHTTLHNTNCSLTLHKSRSHPITLLTYTTHWHYTTQTQVTFTPHQTAHLHYTTQHNWHYTTATSQISLPVPSCLTRAM